MVVDGGSTSFWHNKWLPDGRLKEAFPLLYTHATDAAVSVRDVVGMGLSRFLVPRISRPALEELGKLTTLLGGVTLGEGADRRLCPLADKDNKLRSGRVYSHLMAITGAPPCVFTSYVWGSRAPPRVQFFVWLLFHERINGRANLQRKNILSEDACEVCGASEDCNHIMFTCPFAAQVWSSLGADASTFSVSSLWTTARPPRVPAKHLRLLCATSMLDAVEASERRRLQRSNPVAPPVLVDLPGRSSDVARTTTAGKPISGTELVQPVLFNVRPHSVTGHMFFSSA